MEKAALSDNLPLRGLLLFTWSRRRMAVGDPVEIIDG